MKETHLEKAVRAFLKDEYNLTDVDVTIKITSVTGKKEDTTRLNHDYTNDFDFDLID